MMPTLPPIYYQITQRLSCGLTISSPALHENAWANAVIFDNGPFTRNCAKGCGFVFTITSAYSGRIFDAQTCAQPRKKRCSGVKPSILAGRGLPSIDFWNAAYET